MIFTALDPVCKSQIKKRNAIVKYKYRNRTFVFCSTRCKKAFAENPLVYLSEKDIQKMKAQSKPKKKIMKRSCCG